MNADWLLLSPAFFSPSLFSIIPLAPLNEDISQHTNMYNGCAGATPGIIQHKLTALFQAPSISSVCNPAANDDLKPLVLISFMSNAAGRSCSALWNSERTGERRWAPAGATRTKRRNPCSLCRD